MKSKKLREQVWKLIAYLLCTAGAMVFILPFLWMLSTSLKGDTAIFVFPPQWIPKEFLWSNYKVAWTSLPFNTFLINTLTITFGAILGTILSSTMVAYGFARIPFTGNRFWFIILISTMILPGQVTMIPTFLIFKWLHWLDSFKPLIVPSFFGGGAFFIFLLRQFFMSIPTELDEAAYMDGCSKFGIYWRIMLPLSKPALATVIVFSFLNYWNDFLGPLIYLNSENNYTLAVGLSLFNTWHNTSYQLLMAASLIVLLPVIIIFFFAQRYFIEGITLTGIKG
jgi:multiple sugar transport system permease protein